MANNPNLQSDSIGAEKLRLERLKQIQNENDIMQHKNDYDPFDYNTKDMSAKEKAQAVSAERERIRRKSSLDALNRSEESYNKQLQATRSRYPGTIDNNVSLINPITGDGTFNESSIFMQGLGSNGIFDRRGRDWYNKFSRVRAIDPFNTMSVTREYLFFTKPDLHILNPNTGDIAKCVKSSSFMRDAVARYKPVCKQLEFSCEAGSLNANPFATLLSNSVINTLQVPSSSEENGNETGANTWGTKITYRGTSYASDQDHTFSLEFEDSKYIEVFMFFKIYDEYCKMKNLGTLAIDYSDTSDDYKWINYTLNKVLHDQFSIYKIIVGEDGSSIIYWGKYTGVYPKDVPRDVFSDIANSINPLTFSVDFKAQFYRDMDPTILSEFNRLAIGGNFANYEDLPLFDKENFTFDGTWSSMPYIGVTEDTFASDDAASKIMRYKLLWKR